MLPLQGCLALLVEGKKVFGSQKRKADVPPGSEHESHQPDKVNFFHP
jgi:hypothetical protein